MKNEKMITFLYLYIFFIQILHKKIYVYFNNLNHIKSHYTYGHLNITNIII